VLWTNDVASAAPSRFNSLDQERENYRQTYASRSTQPPGGLAGGIEERSRNRRYGHAWRLQSLRRTSRPRDVAGSRLWDHGV